MKTLKLNEWRGFPHFLQKQGDQIDLCDDEPVEVGDVLIHTQYERKFEVTEVVERRPSRGNWGGGVPTPDWFRVGVRELNWN